MIELKESPEGSIFTWEKVLANPKDRRATASITVLQMLCMEKRVSTSPWDRKLPSFFKRQMPKAR